MTNEQKCSISLEKARIVYITTLSLTTALTVVALLQAAGIALGVTP